MTVFAPQTLLHMHCADNHCRK